FRNAVRFSIQDAVREGLHDAESIEALVTQICYRAADLAYVLHTRGETEGETKGGERNRCGHLLFADLRVVRFFGAGPDVVFLKGITIKLPEMTLRQLRQEARATGRSVAEIVRGCLENRSDHTTARALRTCIPTERL